MTDADRWDDKWRQADGPLPEAHALVTELARRLPAGARVLDLAAGRGRQTQALAEAGHRVVAADVSRVALDKLSEALPGVETVCADLTEPLPDGVAGPWDAIVCIDYYAPELVAGLSRALADDGVLVVSVATTTNLERHDKPSARFLADPTDPAPFTGSLPQVQWSAKWRDNGRHELWVLARQ